MGPRLREHGSPGMQPMYHPPAPGLALASLHVGKWATAPPQGTHTPADPRPRTLSTPLQPIWPASRAVGGGPSGARKLTSRCEPAVDLGVDFLVPQVASDLLHRLSDDGDSQHEALGKRRERV